jgi:dienelactone hydrolase
MGRSVVAVLAALGAWAGAAQAAPRIEFSPRAPLVDRTVHVRVVGLRPHERVTVEERFGAVGRGIFRADAHGVVDLARDPSLGGTYTGRRAMGIFWSMRPTGEPPRGSALRVLVGGRLVVSRGFNFRRQVPGVRSTALTVARDGVFGRYYAPPPGRSKHVPVLLFGGSEGGLRTTLEASLLASHGFPALALAYFGEPGLPRSLVRIPLEYFVRAVRLLDREPGVDAKRLVVSGTSRGSEAALLLGADFPRLVHGVVALSLSTSANPGLPAKRTASPPAAWTLAGTPVLGPIPLTRIRGPVFAAAGEDDLLWQSYDALLVLRMELRGRRNVVTLAFPHAGHDVGFPVPNVPTRAVVRTRYGTLDLGGSQQADALARAREWPALLRFLARA